jgi:hypothetical protein
MTALDKVLDIRLGVVKIGTAEVASVSEATFQYTRDMHDVTSPAERSKRFLAGQESASGTVTFQLEYTAETEQAAMMTALTNTTQSSTQVTLLLQTGATAGHQTFSMPVKFSGLSAPIVGEGGAVTYTYDWQSVGDITVGVVGA